MSLRICFGILEVSRDEFIFKALGIPLGVFFLTQPVLPAPRRPRPDWVGCPERRAVSGGPPRLLGCVCTGSLGDPRPRLLGQLRKVIFDFHGRP